MTLFAAISRLAEQMAGTASRLTKRAAIADAVTEVQAQGFPGDLALFCLYLAGLPFPAHDARKLNAGGSLLTKAVFLVSGASEAEFTAAYRRHGDLGAAAYDLLAGKAPTQATLTLLEVRDAFAGMVTARTTAIRAHLLEGLLRKSTALDAKYLLKLMLGDMRIGVKESLVEEAIAQASGTDVAAVRHAVMLEADLGAAAARAFAGTLGEARMTLFHPLGVMLASPVDTPEEAIERFTAKPPKSAPAKKPGRRKRGDPPVAEGLDEAMAETLVSDLTNAYVASVIEAHVAPATEASVSPATSAYVAPTSASVVPAFAANATKSYVVDATEAYAAEVTDAYVADKDVYTADAANSYVAEATESQGVHAFLEDKFDGMRAQIHCGDPTQAGRVAIYSRNRDEVTESFPELAEAFAHVPEPVILDGEILGWDFQTGQALPFAILGQRIGRKKVGEDVRRSIPVVFMAFDLMFAQGELHLPLPLRERRKRLEALIDSISPRTRSPLAAPPAHKPQTRLFEVEAPPEPAGVPRLLLSSARLVESAEEIDRAYADSRARANEGVMLKAAASPYLPGRRGYLWVKLKRELGSLDVVVTGAEYGSGRKSQFLSDYTFAVQSASGELLNVGKAYSGVTDAEIDELTEFLKAHTLEDHGHFRTVEPLVIFEVTFNNIMRSDRHASGYALRFPRILRIRTDKPLSEIDTVARVEEIYQSQVDKPAEPA